MVEFILWFSSMVFAAGARTAGEAAPPRLDRRPPPPSKKKPSPLLDRPISKEDEQMIVSAIDMYPSYVETQIEDAKEEVGPKAASTWKGLLGRLPFLTEMTAMWWVLQDPDIPNIVKLEPAAAIIYAISPYDIDWLPVVGWADDAAFLSHAFWQVYDYIEPHHIADADRWLRAFGIEPKPLFALHKEFDEIEVPVPALPASQEP